MVQKTKIITYITTLMLLPGCNHKSDYYYFYQFQDRNDCEQCFPAYCFYYDSAFHYTAIQYGFYENNSGFLHDSLFFTSMRDSIVATKIPSTYSDVYFDSLKCYFEYPSNWRFTFEMSVSKQGKCQLFLHTPYNKEGLYIFEPTASERGLIDYSVCQMSTKDTGLFLKKKKKKPIPGDPVYFIIKLYHGQKICSYIGNQDADDVPENIFFFRDALGAIAQNHFSKQDPVAKSMVYQPVSDELSQILHQHGVYDCSETDSNATD